MAMQGNFRQEKVLKRFFSLYEICLFVSSKTD